MHFSIALLLHFVCELKCKPDVQHTPGRRQLFNCSPPISLLLLSWHYSNNISCNIVPHFLVNSPWFLFSERKYLISKIISFFGSVFLPLSFNSYLTAKDKKNPFTFLFSTYKPLLWYFLERHYPLLHWTVQNKQICWTMLCAGSELRRPRLSFCTLCNWNIEPQKRSLCFNWMVSKSKRIHLFFIL